MWIRSWKSAGVVVAVLFAGGPLYVADAAGPVIFSQGDACIDGTYVVPPGITQLKITAVGGPGGAGQDDSHGTFGGAGGAGTRLQTIVNVTPGQTLYVNVAGAYVQTPPASSGAAGGPGGRHPFFGPVNVGGAGGAATWVAGGYGGYAGGKGSLSAVCWPLSKGI